VQIRPNECDNDFSRRQEKNIFGQLNPGNGIETGFLPDALADPGPHLASLSGRSLSAAR
jgi:hypothetical protein